MNLKKKCILALFIASSIPLIIYTGISLNNSIQTATKNALAENAQRSTIVQEKVNNFIDKNLFGIKLLAVNPSVRSYNAQEIRSLVVNATKIYTDLNPILVDAHDGNQVARSDSFPLVSVADRNFFKQAIKGQSDVISEVLVSKDNGHLISVLAAPVTDSVTGNVTGVVQGTVELSVLNDFVKNLSTDQVTVYILDRDGKLLAHPTKNLQQPEERVDMTNYEFVKRGLAGNNGSEEVMMNDKKMLVSYVKNEKSGWLICTEIPYSVAIAQSLHDAQTTSLIGLLLLLINIGIAYFLSSVAIKPILALVTAANSIAAGNLTIEHIKIKSKDELGLLAEAFNTMVGTLTQLIRKTQENAKLVATSAEQLTAGSEQSAQAATQVATSITEVAQGAEKQRQLMESSSKMAVQLADSLKLVTSNANIVSEQSTRTAQTAQEGGQAVQNAVNHMSELELTVTESAKVVTQLGERSKEIGQIVNTISGLAGQTNLLALNAAIEAARAGEQGRGFAVVAEEVRKLAEQSQVAAKQIEDLISAIQSETDKAVQAMDKGTDKVKVGTNVVNDAGTAFQQIIDMITQLSQEVNEIFTAIQTADKASQEILTSVENVATLTETVTSESQLVSAATEEQSASMEQIAASSQSLAKMAAELQNAISKFRT